MKLSPTYYKEHTVSTVDHIKDESFCHQHGFLLCVDEQNEKSKDIDLPV